MQGDEDGLEALAIEVLKTLQPTDSFAVRLVVLTLLGLQAVPEATAKDIQRLVVADQGIFLDEKDIRILYRFADKNYRVFGEKLSFSWDEEEEDIVRNPGAGFIPISPTAANEASDSSAPLSAPTSPDGHGAHGDLMTLTGKRPRCAALEGDGTPQDYAVSHQPPNRFGV